VHTSISSLLISFGYSSKAHYLSASKIETSFIFYYFVHIFVLGIKSRCCCILCECDTSEDYPSYEISVEEVVLEFLIL